MEEGKMRFSNNNIDWSRPETYTTTKTWMLAEGLDGERTVFARFRDSARNWMRESVFDDIILDTTPPETPVVIDDGQQTSSTNQLHASWSSSDETSGVAEYHYAIGTAPLEVDVVDWTSVGINIEVTKTGLDLVPGKYYYFSVKARDNAGNWSDIGCSDGILVEKNLPPQIIEILPHPGSTFLSGSQIDIQVMATDETPEVLEYQFSIAGDIKQSWSYSSTFTWPSTVDDVGSFKLLCEVRDHLGQISSVEVYYYLIQPSVEEAFKYLNANYTLIQDLTADVVISSDLNGEPFGRSQYCRYYFKAPGKQKTVTYSDERHPGPIDIIISDGSYLYIIDPDTGELLQQADLLSESGITRRKFNQTDILYNTEEFVQSHNLEMVDNPVDLNEGIINIMAIPKTGDAFYSYLILKIDYLKGLLVESQLFNDKKEPLQIIQMLEPIQMSNGAWLATTIIETLNLNLSSSILTTKWVYYNIDINSGISEEIFNPGAGY
jgi:hypothetical protein